MPETTNLALINGHVHLADTAELAEAVSVSDQRIAAVGDSRTIREKAGPSARIIDLDGRHLMPAFTDGHTHLHRTALLRAYFLDFSTLRPASIADVLGLVRQRTAEQPEELWVQGDNLSANALAEGRLPTRDELDSVSGDHCVVLRTVGKHGIAANSKALAAAGIDRDTPDPVGGRIERGADGTPTGVLHETAKLALDATRGDTVVPTVDLERRLDALERALAELNKFGIAEIHEIVQSPNEMRDYLELRERGRLSTRVVFYIRVIEGQASIDDLVAIGLRTGFGDDWLRLGGIKLSVDGAETPRNAALYEDYLDDPGNRGLIRINQDVLNDTVVRAARAGLQSAIHAIGPRAVDMALESLTLAKERVPNSPKLRHRIEHGFLAPRPGQLERIRDLDVVISTQPIMLWRGADLWPTRFRAEDVERMMPMRTLLDLGIPVHINSDLPNAPENPLLNIRTAHDRLSRGGTKVGQQEAISLRDAFSLATRTPCFSAFEEGKRGEIAPGRLADLMIVNGDPYDESSIGKVRVDGTIVGGQVVYLSEDA